MSESVMREQMKQLESELSACRKELEAWQRPFDQGRFDAVKEQAQNGHSKSLAAMRVYVVALEHALKHQGKELEKEIANKKEFERDWLKASDEVLKLRNELEEVCQHLGCHRAYIIQEIDQLTERADSQPNADQFRQLTADRDRLAVLIIELATAVDNAHEDIGGSRSQLDILREAVTVAERKQL